MYYCTYLYQDNKVVYSKPWDISLDRQNVNIITEHIR